jgi:hypothetical protein
MALPSCFSVIWLLTRRWRRVWEGVGRGGEMVSVEGEGAALKERLACGSPASHTSPLWNAAAWSSASGP